MSGDEEVSAETAQGNAATAADQVSGDGEAAAIVEVSAESAQGSATTAADDGNCGGEAVATVGGAAEGVDADEAVADVYMLDEEDAAPAASGAGDEDAPAQVAEVESAPTPRAEGDASPPGAEGDAPPPAAEREASATAASHEALAATDSAETEVCANATVATDASATSASAAEASRTEASAANASAAEFSAGDVPAVENSPAPATASDAGSATNGSEAAAVADATSAPVSIENTSEEAKPALAAESPAASPSADGAVPSDKPTSAASKAADVEDEDMIDDIVPFVCYDDSDPKSLFFKEGRWIVPKRDNFPSVFCATRVRVRLEWGDASAGNGSSEKLANLSQDAIRQVLQDGLGFGKTLVRWEDARDQDVAASAVAARELVVAINGELPSSCTIGSVAKAENSNVVATIMETAETCDDVDPARITVLAAQFKAAADNDAIVLELPQLWVIPDPDFRAKTPSIGLYPGSFWMSFLKSWGAVMTAEIFFRTAQNRGKEQMIQLVVKFRERECLKMCFTFLFDRYLLHPKHKKDLRSPWCRLVMFSDFKAKALGKGAAGKPAAKKAAAKEKAPTLTAKPKAKPVPAKAKANVPAPAGATPLTPTPQQARSAASTASATPVTPVAKRTTPPLPKAPEASNSGVAGDDAGAVLSPAEAMHGLSGKQLEAFQMVMSRMERLERENQELMQILLQMQGLLQQQQERNARQAAQLASHGITPMQGSAAAGPVQTVAAPVPGSAAMPPPPVPTRAIKRKAAVAAGDGSEESHYARAQAPEEDAPWKSQRKRPRRARVASAATGNAACASAGVAGVMVAMPGAVPPPPPPPVSAPTSNGAGLAAYEAALLGN